MSGLPTSGSPTSADQAGKNSMQPIIPPTTNVRFAGLGGTGVIKASDIFADVAFRLGNIVKKAEVYGMSQRGGSVQSDVRFGTAVHSPMITEGECDFLVVLEQSQVDVGRGGGETPLDCRPRSTKTG
jgi:Pyruvate/2-oxoacid:ferredoxin oxidoreductase gamma subunit